MRWCRTPAGRAVRRCPICPLKKTPLYLGIVVSSFGAAAGFGPIMEGALTDRLSWRWCFWINVPVGIVCASVPTMPGFSHQHKLGLGRFSNLVQRVHGTFLAYTLPKSLTGKKGSKDNSFRGIELDITSPSLGMKSSLNTKSQVGAMEDGYVEIEGRAEVGLETRRGEMSWVGKPVVGVFGEDARWDRYGERWFSQV